MQVFRSSSRLANAMRALIARSADALHLDFLCEAVRSAFSGIYVLGQMVGRGVVSWISLDFASIFTCEEPL